MKRILRPLMPPWSLIILKYASSVRSIAPYAPAGPSCGPQLPTTTSVSVTPVTTDFAVAADVAGADAAAGGVVADPQAVTSSATSNRTTCATRGRDRSCVLESCRSKGSLLLAFVALMPEICAPHLLPLPERRAPIAEHHASGLEDVRAVGDVERHVHVLLDEEHGRAGGADLTDDTEDLLDQNRCKAKRWLVEQEQTWPGHEGSSDGEHLLLTAAQGSAALLQPLAQAREIVEHARLLACGTEIASGVPTEHQVLVHREICEDLPSLRHLHDPQTHQAIWAHPVDAPTVELDCAPRRPEEAGDHPQRRGLARAVRSEQRDDAPLGDLETDAVQGADAPVVRLDLVHNEELTRPTTHPGPHAPVPRCTTR